MEPTQVGVLIKEERAKKSLSLWKLADLCGKSPQTINAVELGESQNPQLGTILPISDALGIPRERVYELLSPPPNGNAPATT